ncbi:MAG: DNA primase [Chloroflexi bacterium]|nr:DNA primase [Chloroflexota bacterium]
MSVVDEIKQRLDIIEVVSGYVTLKKAGRNYKGICPFHAEKTPSFIVFPDTQSWHCFGACGTGGDVFTFVMRQENLDFSAALRLLAQRAGVSLKPRTEADLAEDKLQRRLREINETAAQYFHNLLLNSTAGETALGYLSQREINRETINRFQLGYALDDWQALGDFLQERGYQREDILAAGLIVVREDSSGHYDRFRGRLIIPIRDERGGVVGFGARALDDSIPKYINSPQTPVFDKSALLFGLDLAKGAIRREGLAIIVEGYMDVLMAHQHGVANVVASMGTALTETQLRLLRRFSKRLALALDADAAGYQATLRSMTLAHETLSERVVPVPTPRGLIKYESHLDVDIRIITLPQGQDPDKVIREDPALWARLVENALPIVDYYFKAITSELDLDSPKGKAEAVRRLMPIIQEIGNAVERTHYIQKLARLVRVDEKTLLHQAGMKDKRAKRYEEKPVLSRSEGKESRPDRDEFTFGPEEYCLSILFVRPHLLGSLDEALRDVGVDGLNVDDFTQAENRAIFASWREGLELKESFREKLDPTLHPRFDLLLAGPKGAPPLDDDQAERALIEGGLRLRQRRLQRLVEELRFLQTDAEELGEVVIEEYGQMVDSYRSALWGISRALAARSFFGRREARIPGLVA